jgi:hypothetical protein
MVWHIPIIPAFGRLRQEDCKFETMGYTARPTATFFDDQREHSFMCIF